MKRILLTILLLGVSGTSFSQIKERTSTSTLYTGFGYKFIFLTNSGARNAYPVFQLSNGDFLKEIDGYLGVLINEKYGIEFSAGYLFTNAVDSDGFFFTDANGKRFYVPVNTRLFGLPLLARFKYYPFSKNYTSSVSKFYFGGGAGAVYLDEEITNQIYTDQNQFNYVGARTSKGQLWTPSFEFYVGIGSFSKIGYGFELGYRFIPLDRTFDKPLITNIVSNFNSVNLNANVLLSF